MGGSWRLALVFWAIPVLLIAAVVMLLRPEGLLPSARRRREFEKGVADEPLRDKALA